ncbi:MAG TPA: hypothetical protein V6C82_05915, partial [Chroococcales cyanobacterium]
MIKEVKKENVTPSRPNRAVNAIKRGTAQLSAVVKESAKFASDRLQLSTAQKLKEGNKRAVGYAAESLKETVTHPFDTLKDMASGVADTVLHPEKALASVAERYGKSKVDGAIAAGNLGASVTGIGAIALTAGAFLAAPFTGGTSLALLPVAGSVGAVAGVIGLGSLGVSILKNQSDIAGAKTLSELEKQSKELGSDFASAGLEVV